MAKLPEVPDREAAEKMILAKLYADRVIRVDVIAKKVVMDMRKSILVEAYKEESYDDIISILNRTKAGLIKQGYEVNARWLEGTE